MGTAARLKRFMIDKTPLGCQGAGPGGQRDTRPRLTAPHQGNSRLHSDVREVTLQAVLRCAMLVSWRVHQGTPSP